MLKALLPALLLVTIILQLFSCLREKTFLRMLTKVLLMPLLGYCWICWADSPSWLVLCGIFLGGFGDLALLWPLKKLPFFLGELSFLLGHVCYLSYILSASEISLSPVPIMAISAVYLAGSSFIYIKTRKEIPALLRPSSFIYMLALSALSALTLMVLISSPGTGTALAFAGATLFLASDGILSQMLFILKKESRLLNFTVMLTYIGAQVLLAAGWAMG